MRKLAAGILLAGALMTAPALAANAPDWNGTWVGNWQKGQGTQIVFAGNTFISFFWDGDYTDANGTVSSDAKTVSIIWSGGDAIVTRDTDTTAHIEVHDIGKRNVTFALKKDK